jgi:hypothetical protein
MVWVTTVVWPSTTHCLMCRSTKNDTFSLRKIRPFTWQKTKSLLRGLSRTSQTLQRWCSWRQLLVLDLMRMATVHLMARLVCGVLSPTILQQEQVATGVEVQWRQSQQMSRIRFTCNTCCNWYCQQLNQSFLAIMVPTFFLGYNMTMLHHNSKVMIHNGKNKKYNGGFTSRNSQQTHQIPMFWTSFFASI